MWEAEPVSSGTDPLLDVTVRDLLAQVSAEDGSPGSGAVAAFTTALAAALVEAAALRAGDEWPGGAEVARLAREARERAGPLAAVNAEVYREALDAMALPAGGSSGERDAVLGFALARAAEVPLEIATLAEEVAALGAVAAECGKASLRPDAVAATLLAGAAAAAAANLVAVNLTMTADDPRARRAHGLAHDASRALERALAAAREP
jgi:formiminotetrahydrofolate cyclodeaminase